MLMQIFESLLAFLIGNIFLILLSKYLLENTGRNLILFVKILLLKKTSHVLTSMIVQLKLKCKAPENKWQVIKENTAMI